MTLNNLRIAPRLGIGFGAVLLLLVAMVAIASHQFGQTARGLATVDDLSQRSGIAREWVGKTQVNVARAVAIAKSSGQPEVEAFFAPQIKKTSAEIGALQKSLETLITDAPGKALMATVAARRKTYVAQRDALFALVKQSDAPAAAELLTSMVLPASEAYLGAMQAVQDREAALARSESAELQQSMGDARLLILWLLAASVGVGAAMSFFISRSVLLPLRQAVGAASVMAGGDLSQPVTSPHRDEFGDLLRAIGSMQTSLHGVVGQVRSSSDSIGTASAEIATGNQDLSARTEQTASNLQRAASSMEQLTGTVRQSADSARQANQLAASAAEVAARGGTVVSQVVATMNDINTSSKKIADIIGTIDGIAFQTNILALNAAVEAARAGEQGRGFAVVASEVRSLAQRSAEAAKEIKGLIGASVDKVEGGSRLVADAGRTMTEIVGSVQRVSDIIGEITAAATEQSQGIEEVNASVNQLDQMTQQNAALVEQSAAAAESLREQAGRLSEVVGAFELGEAMRTAPPAVETASAPVARPVARRAAPREPVTPTMTRSVITRATARPAPRPISAASVPLLTQTVPPEARPAAAPVAADNDWASF